METFYMYIPSPSKSNWHGIDILLVMRPWVFFAIGVGLLFSDFPLWIPEIPSAGAILELASKVVPSINQWSALSAFPENTRLFAIWVWISIPIHAWMILHKGGVIGDQIGRDVVESDNKQPRLKYLLMTFILLVGVILPVFFGLPYLYALRDAFPCRFCVNSDPWAQLALGGLYSFVASALLAFAVEFVRLCVKRNIKEV